LFDLADKLRLDLGASSKAAIEELAGKSLAAEDEALVADFLKRNAGPTTSSDETRSVARGPDPTPSTKDFLS
jgi:hypothetical protein